MSEAETATTQRLASVFAEEIAPALPALEAARRDRLRETYFRAAAAAFVVVLAALIAWLLGQRIAALVIAGLGAVGGAYWVLGPSRRHREAARKLFIPPLLRFLGDIEHHRKPEGRFDLGRVKRAGITGGFNSAKLEDLFIGRHRDTDFRMVEARLKKRRRRGKDSSQPKVFSGLICEISVPVAFDGVVLLVGDKGALGNWIVDLFRGSFEGVAPLQLDHARFEERFQAYSDNPAAADQLLQPALLDSLLAIADDLGRQAVNCAFIEGRFLIALPQRHNLFEIGRLHRSLDTAEDDLRRLAAEFTIPQRLIDNLHGERKAIFPGS